MKLLSIMLCLCGAAFGQTDTYLAYVPAETGGPVYGVEVLTSPEGEAVRMISSIVHGERNTGIVSSPVFDAPGQLDFWYAGHSRHGNNHICLVDAETAEVIIEAAAPGDSNPVRVTWDLTECAGRPVRLELFDNDTGDGWAWVAAGGFPSDAFGTLDSVDGRLPAGWVERSVPPAPVMVDGIPFVKAALTGPGQEGHITAHDTNGVQADRLYVLGGICVPDSSNPAWGGADPRENTFVGDEAGILELVYASGKRDRIPLIYGYTMWWRDPYRSSPAPFSLDAASKAILDEALCIANGVDGYQGDEPYFFALDLRPEPLVEVRIEDSAGKFGYPLIEGLSFATDPDTADLEGFQREQGQALSPELAGWLADHTIRSADPFPSKARKRVEKVARLLYTFDDDITHRSVRACGAPATAPQYHGPKIVFSGPPEASIFSHVFVDNAVELLSRIEPDGMIHESEKGAENWRGFGTYTPGLGPFYDCAYTRNRGPAILGRLGYLDEATRVVDFFDRWFMYFPQNYPELQLGGMPVPAHATVIANKPHVYFDELKNYGWPTRYQVRDLGNPETDGHGMLMLGHWQTWLKTERSAQWVRDRWDALRETAEFIPWALDHPELSFSEHGTLYSESEGGMAMESFYANVPCYLGLLAYADMAEAAGKVDTAVRWRNQAARLFDGMEAYFPLNDPEWGDVWDPAKTADWGNKQGTLAPLTLGIDYWGFLPMQRMPRRWADRTERSYEQALTRMRTQWCAPKGLGYGQNYYAQCALLLDRMQEARHIVDWLARFCYAPRLQDPYRAPEGASLGDNAKVWRRWGDHGNMYQMNETVYTPILMAGIDDSQKDELVIVPRLPWGWRGITVTDMPATVAGENGYQQVRISYDLEHDGEGKSVAMDLVFSEPVENCRVRIGPFPGTCESGMIDRDGQKEEVSLERSGHFRWAWVTLPGESTSHTIKASTR